ncbi:transposase [Patescibacteria group bacterium]|nr:transposase [Patescibacteria group bacterium]
MPYRDQQLVNDEVYHVVLRRIEDELLFKGVDDYYRGIFSIYEFNTTKPVIIRERRKIREQIKKENRDPVSVIDERDRLVDVLTFCLMPNHIHLLLRQRKDGGITKYINKIGAGYPAYFKQKHGLTRKGYFFQGRFVAVHVKDNKQLTTVFVYIHANPISLIQPKWKETGIYNPDEVIKFLEEYRWSSYLDYIGIKNFPSVIEKELLTSLIGNEEKCKEIINNWVKYKGKIQEYEELALE